MNPNLRLGPEAQRLRAVDYAEQRVRWFVEPLVVQGWSLHAIARSLNAYAIRTPSGAGTWSAATVRRVLIRLDLWPSQTKAA